MSGEPPPGPDPPVPPPAPVCLALGPGPVAGFLHLPSPERRRSTAVLICPPFGWDDVCSYRGRRRWAGELAGAGFPVARIDLPGTADSAGGPRDPDLLGAWTRAVTEVSGWLRERTGADRVAAVGVGVGGAVAWRAVAHGAPIDELLLWAVPASGRALVRELRAYASVVAARHPADARDGPPLRTGDIQLIGFVMTAETAAAIEALRLTELALPPAPDRRVLLVGRDRMAPDRRLAAHLEAIGAAVTALDGEGEDYARLTAHPQEAKLPLATIFRSIEWLAERAPGPAAEQAPPARAAPARPSAARRPARERDALELEVGGHPVREVPVECEVPGGRAFGLLAEPVDRPSEALAAVLLNAGALRHTGPNRAWVEMARRWAARGIRTVRADLPGIGDAEGDERGLVPDAAFYEPVRTEQTLALVRALAARGVADRFVLGGLCGGAYWSLHAALASPDVAGALMINLWAFEWSQALADERQGRDSLGAIRVRGLRRLARRDVSRRELREVIGGLRPSRLRSGAQLPAERGQRRLIVGALDRLRERGTETLLLFSEEEALYDQLARQGVVDGLARWPNVTIERIPSRDHMFRALWLQQLVHEACDRGLERTLAAAGSARASRSAG